MKNPTYKTPLKISRGNCQVSFCCIDPILSNIRVEGWITAPSKKEGFDFSFKLAKFFNRQSIGGFCMDETNVHFPFCFDVKPELNKFYQLESHAEIQARIRNIFRKIRKHLI